MTDELVERFRDRIGDDWPAPLDDLVAAAIEEEPDDHRYERRVRDVVAQLSSLESTDAATTELLLPDLLAFDLLESHGGGGQFIAPRSAVTKEVIEVWQSRRGVVQHPLARARFGDGAWALASQVGAKRNAEDARAAARAYLDFERAPANEFRRYQRLSRALDLSLTINDQELAKLAAEAIVSNAVSPAEEGERRHCLTLAMDRLVIERDVDIDDTDQEAVIAAAEDVLAEMAGNSEPFDISQYGERLVQAYRKAGRDEDVKRVSGIVAAEFERWAEMGSALLGMSHYRSAYRLYSDCGLAEEAERVRQLLEGAVVDSEFEMTRHTHTMEVPTEEFVRYAEDATRESLPESRLRFAARLFIPRAALEKSLDDLRSHAPVTFLFPRTVVTSSGPVELAPLSEDREGHLVSHFADQMTFGAPFMSAAASRFVERGNLDASELAQFGERMGIFPSSRRSIRVQAFGAYLAGDFMTTVHLLVPQIEHALRLMLADLGASTSRTRDAQNWRQLTLTRLLEHETLLGYLGRDFVFYLRVLLVEELGWNARDITCHGLAEPGFFSKAIADRLLHAVVCLTSHEARHDAGISSGTSDLPPIQWTAGLGSIRGTSISTPTTVASAAPD